MKGLNILLRLIIILIFISGCNNDDEKIVLENLPPGDFTVLVSEITVNSALLTWNLAIDPEGDQVTYSVVLEGDEVQSNINNPEFLLENLNAQTSYSGKVIASDIKGAKSESTFVFNTDEELVIIDEEDVSITWEKSLGGSLDDEAYKIVQTTDGGYIAIGSSESDDGDVTENKGLRDCWIVKLDGLGNIEWETSLGGSGNDTPHEIQQTVDGGYILGAFSSSSDGDVGGNNGMRDFWIVKLNSTGGIIWETNLGGSKDDILESIKQTTDGGYIASGFSSSNDENVENNNGKADAWVVKLDALGNLEWETNIGEANNDIAASIDQTTDEGYIFTGYTAITSSNRNVMVVKLDPLGNPLWNKSLGGSANDEGVSIQQTLDNGYIIGGYSKSLDGDVGGNNGFNDAWIIKLDMSGNILWEKNLGGSENEGITSIQQTTDGGYIAVGSSSSSDGDVSENNGATDFWVLRLDTSGNILWEKSFGDTSDDYGTSVQETSDGSYVVIGTTFTNIIDNGESSSGDFNYWVIKLE